MVSTRLVPLCLAALATTCAPSILRAQDNTGYERALARYKECITRIPFRFQVEGREALAQTRNLEALKILANDYAKTKDHVEYARYTIAAMLGKNFDNSDAAPLLSTLRKEHTKLGDMWMWYNAMRIEIDRIGDTEATTLIRESKNHTHRAVAIAALGASRNGHLKEAIVGTCLEFPKKESDRNVLLGAMTGALYENKSRVNEAEYRDALKAYISLLGPDVGLTHTAKVQMARHLQWILRGPAMFINPEPWLELLERGEIKAPPKQGTTAQPSFFGVETDGERICYVVDMSDSMLKKITPSQKPPNAPLTGPRKAPKKGVLDESDLPWFKIDTRWDLAREQLKISLSRLTPDKYFSIVWFGDASDTLESCPGMIKASKGNIQRVVAELESIKPKKPQTQEEIQQAGGEEFILRGSTNMHSGIRRAFGLAGRGYVESFAYVDPEALTEGCDTIFLLSDGAPSWDDFSALDKDFGEGTPVASVEQGTPGQRQPIMRYWGPYHLDNWLVEDVRRMNAFRRIRMHCIGLGEANMGLLKQLAVVGNGETFSFGDKQGDAAREEQEKKERERAKAEAAAKAKAEAEAKAKAEQEAKDKEKDKKKK